MLAYALKEVLNLVPETLEMVKLASIEENFPVDSKDSCIASALELEYHKFIDHKPVDFKSMEKVAMAVKLYGVQEEVKNASEKMVKVALERITARRELEELKPSFLAKQASFDGDLSGFPDQSELSSKASQLYKQAKELGVEPSEDIRRYSGNAFLSKEAAINALASRYYVTKQPAFVKIAVAINKSNTDSYTPEAIQDICSTVALMDKEAHLDVKGFNFYKEALLMKTSQIVSALVISLGKHQVPYESILRIGQSNLAHYLGEETAKSIFDDPLEGKRTLEGLDPGTKELVFRLSKSI